MNDKTAPNTNSNFSFQIRTMKQECTLIRDDVPMLQNNSRSESATITVKQTDRKNQTTQNVQKKVSFKSCFDDNLFEASKVESVAAHSRTTINQSNIQGIQQTITRNSKKSSKKHARNPIPIKTKRIIYARAQGQCEYQSPNNQRCPSNYQLEFDHILSVSQGGTNSINNLQLLCRTHNQIKVFKTHGFIYQKNQQSKAFHHTIDLNCKNRTAKPDIK